MKKIHFLWMPCMAVLALGACSSTPVEKPAVTASAEPAHKEIPVSPPPTAQPQPMPAPVAEKVLPPYLDPHNPISTERSVYFAYDRSELNDHDARLIERHGNFLATAPTVFVRIEGNCDERGGREYNLALGQRRADAVASRLKLMGARQAQMETVSYGKEKPRAMGHDESAWSQNRRADIVYPSK